MTKFIAGIEQNTMNIGATIMTILNFVYGIGMSYIIKMKLYSHFIIFRISCSKSSPKEFYLLQTFEWLIKDFGLIN